MEGNEEGVPRERLAAAMGTVAAFVHHGRIFTTLHLLQFLAEARTHWQTAGSTEIQSVADACERSPFYWVSVLMSRFPPDTLTTRPLP
ncbi:hypothetical protein [Nonomuraea aurantiaca]|uniref:hypothetical protein n=1 Tax=Nonomuraea aurantiaca TaxID=2878562 RepID=UPI001CD91EA1|nr:hypothetical protein [Nonomuraea aurantiaca]MCA2230288.1 hypothetical protein [Nonomuraea aurantiaca]